MKQTLTVDLTKELYDTLKEEAKQKQLTLAAYVRLILQDRNN